MLLSVRSSRRILTTAAYEGSYAARFQLWSCDLCYTTEKNITNTLTLVPVGMQVGFEGPRHVLLY